MTKISDREEIEQIVCSILTENPDILKQAMVALFSESVATQLTKNLILPTSKAWKELGYETRDSLYEAVSSGLFRLGIEVEDRRKPSGKLPRYYFNIGKCRKRLEQLPEKRKI